MKNFLRRAVKTFKQYADANLLTFGQSVVTSVGNASGSFPTPMPPLADIGDELTTYANLLQAAASRDKAAVAMKNESKKSVKQLLSLLADYVNFTAQGSESMLAQTAFNLNKIPEPIKIKCPGGLVLTDGPNSGELILKFKSVSGATSYLFQYTLNALLADDSWVSIPSTTTSYTFTGLAKGTVYFCRVVALGSNQQLMNSIILNRVSQ